MTYEKAKFELERNHLYAKYIYATTGSPPNVIGLRIEYATIIKDDGIAYVKNVLPEGFKIEWEGSYILVTIINGKK